MMAKNRAAFGRASRSLGLCAVLLGGVPGCGGKTGIGDFDDAVAAAGTKTGASGGRSGGAGMAGSTAAGGDASGGGGAPPGGGGFGGFVPAGGFAGAGTAGVAPAAGSGGVTVAGGAAVGGMPNDACAGELSSPLRRLSRGEHERALEQILGAGVNRAVEADAPASDFYADIAEVALARAEAASFEEGFTCDPAVTGYDCAEEFVEYLVEPAYRRSLGSEHVEQYYQLFLATEDRRSLIQAVLLSPYFNYEVAFGSEDVRTLPRVPAGAVPLSAHEYAHRLSFFLWGEPADEALLERSREVFSTPIGRRQLVSELLADDRLAQGAMALADRWLGLHRLESGETGLSEELAADARLETQLFFGQMVMDSARLIDLFSAQASFLSEPLAAHYGAPGGSSDFPWVVLPRGQRSGLLTQTSLLALYPSIASRGAWIREEFLCQSLAPPGDIDFNRTDFTPDEYLAAMSEPVCWGCHQFLGPIGLSFTSYDFIGKYRTQYPDGTPVQLEGELVGSDVDGEFTGPLGLAERLAQSQLVHSCLADGWLSRVRGRDSPECFASQRLPSAGSTLREILAEVVQHEMVRLVPVAEIPGAQFGMAPWELATYEAESLAGVFTGEASDEMRAYAAWLRDYGADLQP